MADGWKKGLGHYSAASAGLDSRSHDNSAGPIKDLEWRDGNGFSGPLPRGGEPRYAPKGDYGTKPVEAYSPTGKYAKKGGKGQRSGA